MTQDDMYMHIAEEHERDMELADTRRPQTNKVEFRRFIDRWPKPVGDLQTIAAKITTPSGKRFLVVLHEKSTLEGWDSLEIQRLDENGDIVVQNEEGETISWIRDRHHDDLFASELFGELTGKYAFQIEEDSTIELEVIRHYSVKVRQERW